MFVGKTRFCKYFLFKMELKSLNTKRFLQLILRESVHKTFGQYTVAPIVSIHANKQNNGLLYQYKVPGNMCSSQHKHFTTSAILAVFDELSTNGLMIKDRNHRGGVSVHLTTEILQPVNRDEIVTINTHCDKIGKVLGFCTMEMVNKEGHVLARGKHIKFLPMGWLWQVLTHSLILPIALFIYEKFHATKFKTVLDKIMFQPRDATAIDGGEIGELYKNLNVSEVKHSASNSEGNNNNVKYYEVRVKSHMKNRLGAFHGGAVATCIEDACNQFLRNSGSNDDGNLILTSMDVRYISSMKGELLIRVEDDVDEKLAAKRFFGAILDKQGKNVSAEFSCHYTRHINEK